MGVLEWVLQGIPLAILLSNAIMSTGVPQCGTLKNNPINLTNHLHTKPYILVKCDVCASVSFFQFKSHFRLQQSNRTRSLLLALMISSFQGFDPHRHFRVPEMLFDFPFSNGFLTCRPWAWVPKQQEKEDWCHPNQTSHPKQPGFISNPKTGVGNLVLRGWTFPTPNLLTWQSSEGL